MYYPDTNATVKLTGSPSLLMNNLSSSNVDSMCYVRLDEVFIVQASGESLKLPISKCKIYQASFLDVQGKCVLVVLSNLGVQLWSMYGDTMMFYFPLNSILGFEGEFEKFLRGAAALQDFFCVGCSTGNILVFSCRDGGNYPLLHNLESEKVAISSLSSSSTLLVAANDNGKIFGYSGADAFEKCFSFPGYGSPCTALCQQGDLLLAGYVTGHIRGFRTDIIELSFEITAHTRAVTGLSLSKNERSGTGTELASCSQDQCLLVWGLPDYRSSSSSRVSLLYSECLSHKMCTGVAFLSGERICVASYDEEEIDLFRKMK
mmetsp:Transcript_46471/g.92048  ORF Transcript_46471/g.92048 Transcript_46471/m.92048 type:complete len:318 (+) Transcript_46471:124-1077(+)